MKKGTVTFNGRGQLHVTPSVKDGRAVITQKPIDEDSIARFRFVDAHVDACANDTHTGSVDEQLVAGAAFDHLGIAGNHSYASCESSLRHRSGNHTHRVDRQTFLDNYRTRQVKRDCAANREIVDGAADGELANIAARKIKRLHHV